VNSQTPYDLTRITLVVLIICVLIAASMWTMLPFLGALVWAATIVVATWPLMLRVQRLAGGRRWVATVIMTLVMLLIFIVPISLAIGTLFDATAQGVELVRTYFTQGLGEPPTWVSKLPWVGSKVATKWHEIAAGGPEALTQIAQPYVRVAASWVLGVSGGLGMVTLHFLLIIIIVAILYTNGEAAATGVLMFARRTGQERGERVVRLAGAAVRGVALGVIVTAIVQSILAGLGLWLSGVPRPGLLLALVFALCVAQLGPVLVLAPAVVWLYWSGSFGWATALLVWTVLVGALDNILRPILIRRGVDLPLLLIIAGVIGGLIGFGIIGLFVGPVILAVTYTLLESWIRDDPAAAQ
jgi:predicted PurR-regulated permease PerM